MGLNDVSRRGLMAGAIGAAAMTSTIARGAPSPGGQYRIRGSPRSLQAGAVVAAAAILNDIAIVSSSPAWVDVPMQTNGFVLRLDTNGSSGIIDLSKIRLEVEDPGFDRLGAPARYRRTIGVRDLLRGPAGGTAYYTSSSDTIYLVLDERIYRQDALWKTEIVSLVLDEGWLTGQPALIIDGANVERLDSQPYLPFPVKVPTIPFQPTATGQFPLEVAGMNDFARDGSAFACVEAWATVAGIDGAPSRCSIVTRSGETPALGTPSGLPAPVYALSVETASLPDGPGEIRYCVKPWIGPPWLSIEKGEAYPTANAPAGLPFVNDASGCFRPIYGIVAQDGSGNDGSLLSGLSATIDGAWASGTRYRDPAAVAKAVRTFNASAVPLQTADGFRARTTPHNDIAGGAAVLCPVAGSQVGQHNGAYAIRTGFAASATYPTGATCFEIRSWSGLPGDDVRLRGVLPTGAAVSAANKAVPARLILRGITLDGTGTTTTQNVVIDGTAAAGAATVKPAATAAAYLISVDCRFLENEAAGSANAIRYRSGYMWDVRVEHQGISGVSALAANPALHAALCVAVGSLYSRSVRGSALSPTCILGVKTVNVPVVSQFLGAQPSFTGQLVQNVRIDFTTAFTSPAILLATPRPVTGGLGLCNVFIRGTVDSGGPLMQIGADGARTEIDNALIQHFGHVLLNSSAPSNGRVNLLYQDQGYIRVNKLGSVSYCAFICYSTKGDTFAAPEKAGASATASEKSWAPGSAYYKGAIVWNTPGAATSASSFFQALQDVAGGEAVALADTARWFARGAVFGQAYGAQSRRQGNAAFRYHVGCRGNVAVLTYNTADLTSTASGYGYAWGRDETIKASFASYYIDPYGGDFRPQPSGVLANRVGAGRACIAFDLDGAPRFNDGTGAAGAYERAA